ncbi:MAG: ABC transporter permease, partial [Solobacterium sp.]|nr:ABC transporter permease [Solobacterium sp.]
MAGFKAAVYKDLKLFLKGTGIITLFLPFLLLGFMYMGIRNMSAESLIHPYKVAVRDEDRTAMSNVIIQQAEQIEFFEEVTQVTDETSDEELIRNGYGAVFTIPKDYFYQVWYMNQEPVRITLNADMPMESAAFQAVMTSIMDIMKTEQASSIAVYEYVYGDTSSVKQQMYNECAKLLVTDAMGRKGIFDIRQAVTDISLAALRRFMAACMILLVFFQAISTMKTLPDEKRLGVMPRFEAAGRSPSVFILSKFIFLFILTMPALVLFGLILGFSVSWNISLIQISGYIFLCLLTILVCGAAALLLSDICPTSASVMRYGNLVLIISLFFSGTFIAVSSLPSFLQPLHALAVPTYVFRGLECIHRRMGLLTILKELLPMLLMAAAFFAADALLRKKTFAFKRQPADGSKGEVNGGMGFLYKLKGISLMKLFHMNGRTAGAVMIILSVIFAAAASAGNRAASSIRIAVIDRDGTAESQLLADSLSREDSISIVSMSGSQAIHAILDESIEGAVTITGSYTAWLYDESKKNSVIGYDSASSS